MFSLSLNHIKNISKFNDGFVFIDFAARANASIKVCSFFVYYFSSPYFTMRDKLK